MTSSDVSPCLLLSSYSPPTWSPPESVEITGRCSSDGKAIFLVKRQGQREAKEEISRYYVKNHASFTTEVEQFWVSPDEWVRAEVAANDELHQRLLNNTDPFIVNFDLDLTPQQTQHAQQMADKLNRQLHWDRFVASQPTHSSLTTPSHTSPPPSSTIASTASLIDPGEDDYGDGYDSDYS